MLTWGSWKGGDIKRLTFTDEFFVVSVNWTNPLTIIRYLLDRDYRLIGLK